MLGGGGGGQFPVGKVIQTFFGFSWISLLVLAAWIFLNLAPLDKFKLGFSRC